MKLTRSKDGRLRATITSKHRVGTEILEVAVAEILWEARDADDIYPTFSRTMIEKKVRDMLQRYGDSVYEVWARHEGDGLYDEAVEEAPDIVTNFFREMRKDQS